MLTRIWLLSNVTSLNYVTSMVQLFRLHGDKAHAPWSQQCELQMMWWPCWIAYNSTSKVVVVMVLVNWRWPELTNNGLKWQNLLTIWKSNEWRGQDHCTHRQSCAARAASATHASAPAAVGPLLLPFKISIDFIFGILWKSLYVLLFCWLLARCIWQPLKCLLWEYP